MNDKILKIHMERVFSAGHFVHTAEESSPCRRLHGHDWKAIVDVSGVVKSDGMVIDFRILKSIIDELDHKMLLPDLELARNNGLTEVTETKYCITVSHNSKYYMFPMSDIVILKGIDVITSENIALYLKHKFSESFDADFNIKIYEGNTSYAEA